MPDHLREGVRPKSMETTALRWYSIKDTIERNPYRSADLDLYYSDLQLVMEHDLYDDVMGNFMLPDAFRRGRIFRRCVIDAHICLWTLGHRTPRMEPYILHDVIVATAHHGDAVELESLLSKMSTQDEILNLGIAPLSMAADAGMPSNVSLLLSKGALVNPSSFHDSHSTPLISAIRNGSTGIVSELLRYRADPNCYTINDGKTPLCIAARLGHVEVVKLLLQYGADPSKASRRDILPYEIAKRCGNTEIAELLKPLTHDSSRPAKANE
ncbi:hypothetical protein H2200_010215 [Cladophialophora chaetospira]|uniref:Ankyrin n=1 Tax=Cladophialophora chaetospira TaxID=386627 RepID=A0AA39CEQ0_9EURO|nr:hypothetical protein H2200_010215 [Cladophialophora chaetospira]